VHLGTLELREEVLEVTRERAQSGQVSFHREVKTRTETITTELRRETLVITVKPGTAEVYLGEELLQPGETREVLLYDEQTVVSKVPFVTEELRIGKKTVTEQQQHSVELQYEVLVVDEQEASAPVEEQA
jgi:uncharacterized protein (TIGR02271 family)